MILAGWVVAVHPRPGCRSQASPGGYARPMPASPFPTGRRPSLLVVGLVLLVACVVVVGSTAYLLRDRMTVTEMVISREVPTITPAEPVALEDADGLHLYLVPHPDDELSGWTSLTDAPGLYPVVVLLTAGEATGRCTDAGQDHLQVELGEVVPTPFPPGGRDTPGCREARTSSFRAVLEESAAHSPVVVDLGTAAPRPLDRPGGPATVVEGPHATLVTLDLGDSALESAQVVGVVEELLALRGELLPDLPVARVTSSAYLGTVSGGEPGCAVPALCPADDAAYPYDHADHVATARAARALVEQGRADEAWLVTSTYDPAAGLHRALPAEVYDDFLGLGDGAPAQAERLGSYQRHYGWLAFPDVWRPGDLPLDSAQVLFPRVQSFEVVRP